MDSRLVLGAAVIAAALVGCGGETPAPANPENPPASADGQTGTAEEAQVSGDVTVDDFEEPLGNYGTWLDDDKYGHIWQPADDVTGADFEPYASDGSWSANDDGGWVYQSKYNDEFGWATYHYGRWLEHDDYGWVWQPGVEWAPAWVEWRNGGGYVGYVPMGPEGYTYPENRWVFAEERRFGDPGGVWSVRLAPERIHAVYMAAPLIEVRAGGHWSGGPSVERIKAAGGTVRTVKAAAMSRTAVRAAGKASVARAASSNRPRPTPGGTASASIRRGPKAGTKTQVPVRTVANRASPGAAPQNHGSAATAPAHSAPATTAAPAHSAPATAPQNHGSAGTAPPAHGTAATAPTAATPAKPKPKPPEPAPAVKKPAGKKK